MKKLVAIILVISILFSVGVAFAEEDSPVEDSANIEEQTVDEITDNGEPDTVDVPEADVVQEESIESPFDSMELSEIVKTNDADIIADAIVHFVIDNNENDKAKQLYDMALEAEISFSEINIASIAKALMLDEQSDLLANGTDAKDNSDGMLNSDMKESDAVVADNAYGPDAGRDAYYYLDENGEKVMIHAGTKLYRNTKVYLDRYDAGSFNVYVSKAGNNYISETYYIENLKNGGCFDTGNSIYTVTNTDGHHDSRYWAQYHYEMSVRRETTPASGFYITGTTTMFKEGDLTQTKSISFNDKKGRTVSFVVNDGKNDITIEENGSFNPHGVAYVIKKIDIDNAKIYLEPQKAGGYYFCKEGSEEPDTNKNIPAGTIIDKNSTICRVNGDGNKISFKIDGKTETSGVLKTGDKSYVLFDSENIKSYGPGFIVQTKSNQTKGSYTLMPLTKGMTVNKNSTIKCVNDNGKKVEFRVNIGKTKHNIKIFSFDTSKTLYQVESIDMDGEVPVISLTEPPKPKQYGFYINNNTGETPGEFIEEGDIIPENTPVSYLSKNGQIGYFLVNDGQNKTYFDSYNTFYAKKSYFVKKIELDGARIYLESENLEGVYVVKPDSLKPNMNKKIQVGSVIDKNTKICRVNKEGEILGVVVDGKNVQAPFDTGNNCYYLQSEFNIKQVTSGFYAVNNDKPVFDRKINVGQTLKPGDAICYVNENGQRADYMVDCFNGETTTLKKNECYDISDLYDVKNIGTHSETGLPVIYLGYKMCFKGTNYSEIKEGMVIRKNTSFYATDFIGNKIMFKASTDGSPLYIYPSVKDFNAEKVYKVKKIDYSRKTPEIYLETIDKAPAGFFEVYKNNLDYNRPIYEGATLYNGTKVTFVNENGEQSEYAVHVHVGFSHFESRHDPKKGNYFVVQGVQRRRQVGNAIVRYITKLDDKTYQLSIFCD